MLVVHINVLSPQLNPTVSSLLAKHSANWNNHNICTNCLVAIIYDIFFSSRYHEDPSPLLWFIAGNILFLWEFTCRTWDFFPYPKDGWGISLVSSIVLGMLRSPQGSWGTYLLIKSSNEGLVHQRMHLWVPYNHKRKH